VNPATGHSIVFRQTAAQTGGELLEVDSYYGPDSTEPVEHFHPRQKERFEIVSGAVTVRLNGEQRELRGGDTLEVPPGAVHAIWNACTEQAHVVWQTRPALKTESLFETIWGLASDGKLGRDGKPSPLRGAVLAREYRDEFLLAKPPAAVQTIVFGLLAPIGRLLGYRSRYEKDHGTG
jgi:quercetin dioxygenase-like cupin family protein